MTRFRAVIPASLFGIVLGLAGVGSAWRVAARIWHGRPWSASPSCWWPQPHGPACVLYARNGYFAAPAARAEIEHPIQAGFVSLVPLTTMLMALVLAPYGHASAGPTAWPIINDMPDALDTASSRSISAAPQHTGGRKLHAGAHGQVFHQEHRQCLQRPEFLGFEGE